MVFTLITVIASGKLISLPDFRPMTFLRQGPCALYGCGENGERERLPLSKSPHAHCKVERTSLKPCLNIEPGTDEGRVCAPRGRWYALCYGPLEKDSIVDRQD